MDDYFTKATLKRKINPTLAAAWQTIDVTTRASVLHQQHSAMYIQSGCESKKRTHSSPFKQMYKFNQNLLNSHSIAYCTGRPRQTRWLLRQKTRLIVLNTPCIRAGSNSSPQEDHKSPHRIPCTSTGYYTLPAERTMVHSVGFAIGSHLSSCREPTDQSTTHPEPNPRNLQAFDRIAPKTAESYTRLDI